MHLLPRDLHNLDDAGAAVDLGQSPAEIVFLSFSDSELRLLARLYEQSGATLPSFRCASLAQLKHPYSVDLYLDTVARHARLIVVRLLGGKDYWAYGVEQLEALARAKGIALAIVPGDTHDDARLKQASTLDTETLNRIWRFFQDGGPDNLRSFLGYAATLVGHPAQWRESVPVANAGRFEAACRAGGELRATIVFYRAMFLADDVAPIVALADALAERGFAVEAIYVASLKEAESEAFVSRALEAFAPDVILNATAFSARRDSGKRARSRGRAGAASRSCHLFARSMGSFDARRERRRSRDECRLAGSRRAHLHARDFLQGGSAAASCGGIQRDAACAGTLAHRFRREPRIELGAAAPQTQRGKKPRAHSLGLSGAARPRRLRHRPRRGSKRA